MRKGFTLIELLIVIAILAILGSIVYANYKKHHGLGEAPERVEEVTHQLQKQHTVSSFEESTISELRTAKAEYEAATADRKKSLASLWITQANSLRVDQLPEDLKAFRQTLVNQ